jgi:hypothetical protein
MVDRTMNLWRGQRGDKVENVEVNVGLADLFLRETSLRGERLTPRKDASQLWQRNSKDKSLM